NNDGVTDIAISGAGSINVSMNDSTPISNAGNGAVSFVVSVPSSTVAGTAVPVTVTAMDNTGNVIPDYAGLVRLFSNDPPGRSVSYTFSAAAGGTPPSAAGLTLFTAGNETVLVSAPLVGSTSQAITVTPAAATHLAVTTPASTVAGSPMAFSVVAL